ncbi:MAG: Ig-like domain-containing protein [Treponema sp.]|nr:Ig-like domain-containing protein [Candidatus Treponema equifaecale]
MKKMLKAFATAAALAMLFGFAACSSDDDDDDKSGKGAKLETTRVIDQAFFDAPAGEPGTVTLDGAAMSTIADAIAAITDSADHVIELTAGVYKEDGLRYQGAANITIKGPAADNEYGKKVIIVGKGANMDSEGGNQAGRELLEIAGSGNVVLENITLINNFKKDGDCQAEAFGFDSTGKAAAYNCSFISRQDTTRTTGKAWFYKCYIEGDVDFVWMEQSGKVALYEDCRLRAVTGRQKEGKQVNAYFTAPRVNVIDEATYGKGVVVLNSKIEVENGIQAYLFRNPWSTNSAYYNNVAFVGCTLFGSVGITEKASHNAMYDKLNPCGGFQVANLSGLNNMKAATVTAEYAGRKNILNRVFDSETNSMHKDFANTWDFKALETEFNAVADASLDLLPGEKEIAMISIDFVAPGNAMTADVTVDTEQYTVVQGNYEQSKKGHGFWMRGDESNPTTMVLKNVPKYCKVTFYGCAYGSGSGIVEGPNGFSTTFECDKVVADGTVAGAFVYNGGTEGNLTLKFKAGNAWVHGVFIREYESLTPATGITVTAPKTTIFVDEAVQLKATIAPADVTLKAQKWTSSDASTVFVSDKGLIMGMKTGTATITVATKDGTDKTDSVEITVVEKTAKPVEGKSYSYPMQGGVGNPYFSDDLLFQCKGDSDNGSHGIVMKKDSKAIVDVAGNVKVTLYRCRYDNGDTCVVTDKAGNLVATVIFPEGAGGGVADTDTLEFVYVGPATTLTMTFKGEKGACYLHRVDIDPVKASDIVSVTGITVTAAGDKTTVEVGKKLQLSATVAPESATVKEVSWSSSDNAIATVSATGEVTGAGVGPVTITATAKDGSEVKGTIELTISDPPKPVQGVKYTYDLSPKTIPGVYTSDDTFLKVNATGGNQGSGHGPHFAVNDTITVKVAGACTLQLGGCQYGANTEVKVTGSDGTEVGTFTWAKSAACGDKTDFVYTGAADTLTLTMVSGANTYLNDFTVVPGPYVYDLSPKTVPANVKLDDGAIVVNATGGNQGSGHGPHFAVNDTIVVKVGGACKISLGGCQYGADTVVKVTGSDGTEVGSFTWAKAAACGDLTDFAYTGAADTLTFTMASGANTYLNNLKIVY